MVTEAETSEEAAERKEGHHRLLASFYPCNAHMVIVEISHSRGGTVPQSTPPPSDAYEWWAFYPHYQVKCVFADFSKKIYSLGTYAVT